MRTPTLCADHSKLNGSCAHCKLQAAESAKIRQPAGFTGFAVGAKGRLAHLWFNSERPISAARATRLLPDYCRATLSQGGTDKRPRLSVANGHVMRELTIHLSPSLRRGLPADQHWSGIYARNAQFYARNKPSPCRNAAVQAGDPRNSAAGLGSAGSPCCGCKIFSSQTTSCHAPIL